MNETDELDDIWRAGLNRLAIPARPLPGPVRPDGELGPRRRRVPRRRIAAITAAAAVLVVCLLLVAAMRGSSPGVVATKQPPASPPVVVDVVDAAGGSLSLRFPGRTVSGQPPHLDLPPGFVEFHVDARTAGHQLVLEGVSAFAPTPSGTGVTIRTVRLAPGVYRLYCAIVGHAEAGEQVLLDVH